MKRIATFLTMAMAVVVLAVTVSLAGKVLFEDKFTSMDSGWGIASANVYVKDGKLIISPNLNTGLTVFNQSAFLPDDIDATITAKFLKAPAETYGVGFFFWVNSPTEFYGLWLTPSGTFSVLRSVVGGRLLYPVPWQKSDAIKKGEGVDNVLRVVTKGNKATVYVNGQELAVLNGQPPAGGTQIGMGASSGGTAPNVVAFSNLTVVAP